LKIKELILILKMSSTTTNVGANAIRKKEEDSTVASKRPKT
jgi:hypothetical protein